MNEYPWLNLALVVVLLTLLGSVSRHILRQARPLTLPNLEADPEANTGSQNAQLGFYAQMQDGENSIVIRNMGRSAQFYVERSAVGGRVELFGREVAFIAAGDFYRCQLPVFAADDITFSLIEIMVTAAAISATRRWARQRYYVDKDGITSWPYKVPA